MSMNLPSGVAAASCSLMEAGWPRPPGVFAFTTMRHGAGESGAPFDTFNLGNRYAADGDDPAVVERNRAALVDLAGLPSAPHWLKQVHGIEVLRFTGPAAMGGQGGEPVADAAVTSVAGVVLAILTADCLPVVFSAVDGSEVAVAHAGWRGLVAGVLENTVSAMQASPRDVIAWMGPAAGPRAYEIGEEVFEAFVSRDSDAATAFNATRPGHWRVDLYALARMRLLAAGLVGGAIHGGGLCTISDPARFYSHRRDARTGRMATVAWISPG